MGSRSEADCRSIRAWRSRKHRYLRPCRFGRPTFPRPPVAFQSWVGFTIWRFDTYSIAAGVGFCFESKGGCCCSSPTSRTPSRPASPCGSPSRLSGRPCPSTVPEFITPNAWNSFEDSPVSVGRSTLAPRFHPHDCSGQPTSGSNRTSIRRTTSLGCFRERVLWVHPNPFAGQRW